MSEHREEWARVLEIVASEGLPNPRDLDVALDAIDRALGIPAATLAALRSGEMVAVPREPAPDFWPSYCDANNAMPGSAWDTLSQKLYRAIIAHHARRSQGRAP